VLRAGPAFPSADGDHLAFFKAQLLKKGAEMAAACVQKLMSFRALTATSQIAAAAS